MSKLTRNVLMLSCLAFGGMMVAAAADGNGTKSDCGSCPSQKIMAFFFGDGDGCGSAKVQAAKAKGGCGSDASQASLASAIVNPKAGCSAPCDKAMADLPQLTYRIAELDTPCIKTADAASREKNTPVKFVVAGEVFDDCGPAAVKLASLLEQRVPTMGEIIVVNESAPSASGCPMSGKTVAAGEAKTGYKVAGVTFASIKDAEVAQTKVRAELAKFTTPGVETHGMSPAGGCPHAAQAASKASCGAAQPASATQTAAGGGCGMDKTSTASATEKASSGCSGSKVTVATTGEKSEGKGCCASMKAAAATQVVSATKLGVCCDLNTISAGGCCPSVQELVAVRSRIRALVEAALTAQPALEQTASL